MSKLVIRRYCLDHVLDNDKVLYNTNNHYDERPDDYDQVINSGNTKFWIDKFHKNNYYKLTLDRSELRWMTEASKIGMFRRRFSHMYDDELEDACAKYETQINEINKNLNEDETGWFIRSDRVSLKYGIHRAGPYNNIKEIIESMVTGISGHECFKENDQTCDLYFMRWIDMDPRKEFRIFVHENKITAISDQHLYSVNDWLNSLTDEEIKKIITKILDHFEYNIKDKMSDMGSYVMDLALIGDDETPYFIEPNSFGANYASGSALFQWINDHEMLHNDDVIEFRYVSE